MNTQDLRPIAEQAIKERRQIEIDYEHVDGTERRKRVVAPFDIGTRDPRMADNFKDNLYAFSADHVNKDNDRPEPQVCVFAIAYVHSARLLDSPFDPEECRRTSLKHDSFDWGKRDFNLVPDRDWFKVRA